MAKEKAREEKAASILTLIHGAAVASGNETMARKAAEGLQRGIPLHAMEGRIRIALRNMDPGSVDPGLMDGIAHAISFYEGEFGVDIPGIAGIRSERPDGIVARLAATAEMADALARMSSALNETRAELIQEATHEHLLSQAEIARHLGVGRARVNQILSESARRNR